MKNTGFLRKIDSTKRIYLPEAILEQLHIKSGDVLEFYTIGNQYIVLKKRHQKCIFCGSMTEHLEEFKGFKVCDNCIRDLKLIQL